MTPTARTSRWPRWLALVAVGLAVAVAADSADRGGTGTRAGDPSEAVGDQEGPTDDSGAKPDSSTPSGDSPVEGVAFESLLASELSWESYELDLPGSLDQAWLAHLSAATTGAVAVAFGWSLSTDRQEVITWRHQGDDTWQRSTTRLDAATTMTKVVSTGGHILGLGNHDVDGHTRPLMWRLSDSGSWTTIDLGGVETLVDAYPVAAMVTGAGIVVGAQREERDLATSASFRDGGLLFELDDLAGTFRVSRVSTGSIVSQGSTAELYNLDRDGQAIHDPAGTRLTVVPWETWERLFPRVSPLPIPVEPPTSGGPQAIQWDGYRIEVDQRGDTYSVWAAGGDEAIVEGSLIELYRGPSPAFRDSNGTVVAQFSWARWDELIERAYQERDAAHTEHTAQQVVLHAPEAPTADRWSWSLREVSTGPNTHLEAGFVLGDHYAVLVVDHSTHPGQRRLHRSLDGLEWSSAVVDDERVLGQIVAGPAGLAAVSYAGDQSNLAISVNGLDWRTAVRMTDLADGRQVWAQVVASGPSGRGAVVSVTPRFELATLRVTVDDVTASFGQPASAVHIVDDATGRVLLDLGWDDLDSGRQGASPTTERRPCSPTPAARWSCASPTRRHSRPPLATSPSWTRRYAITWCWNVAPNGRSRHYPPTPSCRPTSWPWDATRS